MRLIRLPKKVMYNKEQLYLLSIEAIQEHDLVFINEIPAYLPCDRSTFFRKIRKGSKEMKHIHDLLNEHKIDKKRYLRKKWYEGKSVAGQIVLYKLLADDNEFERITTKELEGINEDQEEAKEKTTIEFIDAENE